jgi:hypothetical protein
MFAMGSGGRRGRGRKMKVHGRLRGSSTVLQLRAEARGRFCRPKLKCGLRFRRAPRGLSFCPNKAGRREAGYSRCAAAKTFCRPMTRLGITLIKIVHTIYRRDPQKLNGRRVVVVVTSLSAAATSTFTPGEPRRGHVTNRAKLRRGFDRRSPRSRSRAIGGELLKNDYENENEHRCA